ncbi:cilia- and flagella- associated protein 210 isoform X1 [Danio rerio]|uniref:Cilia- and flagella- associated protein 210 isoform X1 n=1 Tax=Danio rerio TaxID=7955 RepID=E7F133_DANRE|nr:coiled-coil domain-containing protein 173 isoform X1 [Danio rerio]|eukprot:XP_002663472.1 coiled-coil domain-containing protein 173 isoform X1 [Danio rerio]
MSTVTSITGVVKYGRRKGSSKQAVNSEMEKTGANLRQVVVLSKSEWQRLQDSVNGINHHNRSVMAAAEQREALHKRSKDIVKNWSNTIAGQRQKKLEAKKIREAIEEEERKLIDIEEAKYQAQMRKEAIEKAKTQMYYQTDRVKGFHGALMLAEVLKEREAQIELKRMKQNATKDIDRDMLAEMASREEQALLEEQKKALQKKQEHQAIVESLKQQIVDHELEKEQERQEVKREAEEIERLRNLHLWEQAMKERKKQGEKRSILKAHRDLLTNREMMKATEAQKLQEEEEKCKQLASHKEKMMKMRKEKQEEIFRELQRHRETIIQKLAVQKQQLISNEEEIIAKAVSEREERLTREQQEKEKKHTDMLNAIAAHRESMRQEQERKVEEEKQKALEMLNAKKEADQIFMEKQQRRAQKAREEGKTLQDLYIQEMAEKRAKHQRTKKDQQEFVEKSNAFIIEEEKQFQTYAKQVIETAERAGRNTYPLIKAAREGIGGGLGPVFGGLRPSYLVHDESGVQMPSYLNSRTQNIKELNETSDIQQSKKRLGFTW